MPRCVSRNGLSHALYKKFKTSFFEWFLFQIRIYDRIKVMLISNCVLYFETPGSSVRLG